MQWEVAGEQGTRPAQNTKHTSCALPSLPPGLVVFFISAVFHEVLVGVPLHMVRMWSFWGIMAQVPLIALTEWLKKSLHSDRIGNAIFWISFCFLGQPLSIILYYHDWRKQQGMQ